LRKQGYRLVYTVEDDALMVLVLAVDHREDSVAYRPALGRLQDKLPPAPVPVPKKPRNQ
jgi:mRNA interferase RelE/StbE